MSPLTALRGSLWGFLVFAGVAWLAIGWSVLRLEPTDVVRVAGPVILFGALTEALKALGGGRMWGLNAGMAALFAVTGVLILVDRDTTFTTPSALIGWYLMVRGAADVVMSVTSRGTDRTWGLVLALGVVQVALGFYAASAWSRTGGTVVLLLGGVALARAIADLVAAMNLRESPAGVESEREHAAGVAGYAAGLADYAAATARAARPRHRAMGAPAIRSGDADAVLDTDDVVDVPDRPEIRTPNPVGTANKVESANEVESASAVETLNPVETTANLDAIVAQARLSGATAVDPQDDLAQDGHAEEREPAFAMAARPATMFTGPHHGTDADGVPSGQGAAAYRVPAGQPAAMSVHGGAADAAIAGADMTSTAMATESGSSVRVLPSMSVGAAALPEAPSGAPAAAVTEGAERPPQANRSGLFWRSKTPGRRRAL